MTFLFAPDFPSSVGSISPQRLRNFVYINTNKRVKVEIAILIRLISHPRKKQGFYSIQQYSSLCDDSHVLNSNTNSDSQTYSTFRNGSEIWKKREESKRSGNETSKHWFVYNFNFKFILGKF